MTAVFNKNYNLDVESGGILPVVCLSQYDDGLNSFTLRLFANNQAVVLPAGVTAVIVGKNAAGFAYALPVEINSNRTAVIVTTAAAMTAAKGMGVAEVVFTDASGNKCGSTNISIRVEASPEDGAIEGEADYSVFYQAISAAAVAQDAAERAEDAAEAAESTVAAAVSVWLSEHVDPDTGYVIDNSLTIAGAAADAYQTGLVKDAVTTESAADVPLTFHTDGSWRTNGNFVTSDPRKYAYVDVTANEIYLLSTRLSSALIPAIVYFDGDTFVSYEKPGTGDSEYVTDYRFAIPQGITKIAVQSAYRLDPITLKKVSIESNAYTKSQSDSMFAGINAVYTKSESDSRYAPIGIASSTGYGVKWSVSDPDDLGSRCFGAVGMTASIGIGATNGHSDFDDIYPWAGMKRCNISTNANGATIITYEGETGFSLNNNVFVRIPKFSIARYIAGGYEYRVIGAPGAPIHEAFIENGKELDEIFVGAFEGFIDSSNKLKSVSNVLPTSNGTPATYLTSAKANGNNYTLYDMRCIDAIWSLMAVEYGCRNTNQIVGYGLADFWQPTLAQGRIIQAASNTNSVTVGHMTENMKHEFPAGSNITICGTSQQDILTQAKMLSFVDNGDDTYTITFDGSPVTVDTDCFVGSAAFNTNWCENSPTGALSWHTGRNNWIADSNTQNAIRYRWIENVVGNLWHYLPDVTFYNLQMYVCNNMADYEFFNHDGVKYKAVGNTLPENTDNGLKGDVTDVNYWISQLVNDTFAKSVLFGKAYDKSLTSTKAFGGYYYLQTGTRCIANGGGFDHLWRCNMLTQRAWIQSTQQWYLYGARLIYKHLN